MNTYFFSEKEGPIEETAVEMLYRYLLPEIPQHMIGFLKILLSAQPSSKAKSDTINILSDLLPPGIDTNQIQGSQSEEGMSGIRKK